MKPCNWCGMHTTHTQKHTRKRTHTQRSSNNNTQQFLYLPRRYTRANTHNHTHTRTVVHQMTPQAYCSNQKNPQEKYLGVVTHCVASATHCRVVKRLCNSYILPVDSCHENMLSFGTLYSSTLIETLISIQIQVIFLNKIIIIEKTETTKPNAEQNKNVNLNLSV